MKQQIPMFNFALMLAGGLFAQESLAKDYTHSNLPDGVGARLG